MNPAFSLSAKIERFFLKVWYRRSRWRFVLWPFSVIFAWISAIRKLSFRLGLRASFRPPVPVIIVGNLTIGGTGKTPTVLALVHALREKGYTPGVITRGYKANTTISQPVSPSTHANEVGDEAILIAQHLQCPTWVGKKRPQAAQALLKAHPEVNVLISDDGLQHYALQRDVELVVFDQRLAGNGYLLPAGPLREPLSRSRDATIINTISEKLPVHWSNTFRLTTQIQSAWQLNHPTNKRAITHFQQNDIVALAGIGHPQRFFDHLKIGGLTLKQTYALPDHYHFDHYPFSKIKAEIILITEKDAVKLSGAQLDPRIWVVPLKSKLPEKCIQLIIEKINESEIT